MVEATFCSDDYYDASLHSKKCQLASLLRAGYLEKSGYAHAWAWME
jgi:hypothetical protein